MIGLEFLINIYGLKNKDIAETLEISPVTVHDWIKGKKKIPLARIEELSKVFENIPTEYFQKELDDIDKLTIQKEKLKQELKPNVSKYQLHFSVNSSDLEEVPLYDSNAINKIEFEIRKAKIIEDMRDALSSSDNDVELQKFEQIALLLKEHRNESIFEFTIDAISHYFNVLPDWVGEPESEEFVEEFIKLASKYDDIESE